MSGNKKFIDIRGVIADKNPALLKVLPGFLLRYLERILHEQEVNNFLAKHNSDDPFTFCKAVIEFMEISLSANGLENIPTEGGCILAVNHPLGGMDAMALVTLIEEKRKDIKFIVNDVLLNLAPLKDMFTGVNKVGKNARESLRAVDELFATEQLICVFPAGLVSRKQKGIVKDLEWKKTFVSRARKYDKPIIPVHINGELTNFFYRLARIRKGIGIKANIEMLYLVNELFKQRGKKMHVIFGEPVPKDLLHSQKSDSEKAQEIKEIVYQLAK
ncbi:MAG: glycerol acyltransferase [Bacteroidetes bacterium]|nr:glycerol acyltransferase [Bacteroidota bacterium]